MNNTTRSEKQDKTHESEEELRREEEQSSSALHKLPGMPSSDDESELGDTDQHAA